MDRWLTGVQAWRLRQDDASVPAATSGTDSPPAAATPLVVDLGFGESPATTIELYRRLHAVHPHVEVIGLEIAPERVVAAQRAVQKRHSELPHLSFRLGGFELPVEREPVIVRAGNVLRQYDADDLPRIWAEVSARLSPHGIFVDSTCDELGRHCSWIALQAQGPVTFSLSLRPGTFDQPSDVAGRLPKALIHRNVPGEPVHRLLQQLDRRWQKHAALAAFGPHQRWIASCRELKAEGWPVLDGPSRWRLGELTVAWPAVASAELTQQLQESFESRSPYRYQGP